MHYILCSETTQLMFTEGCLFIKYLSKVRARLMYSMYSWRSLMEEDSWSIVTKISSLYKYIVLAEGITV